MNGKTTVLFCESSIRNLKHLCRELNVEDTPDRDAAEREILLRGYERWGAGIVHHLYGGFSFALREENGRLFCARDAFGIENFYYCNLPDDRLLCAPNLSGITSNPGYRKAIDPEALQIYTIFGYPAGERTLWRGIRKLMPGCTLTRDKGPAAIGRWYRPSFHPEYGVSEQEWADRIRDTLEEILEEDRLSAGLSGGSAFLSGGVDSSLLLAASGVRRAASVSFPKPAFSEWEAASRTAAYLGRDLQNITLTAKDYISALPRLVRNMGLPMADPSAGAFMLGCERVPRENGPWLSGEGADEFFAGYYVYRRVDELTQDGGSLYYGCDAAMDQDDALRLLRGAEVLPLGGLVRELYGQSSEWESLSRLLLIDIGLWFEGDILFAAGRSARANGIKLTLPFADRRMFELSAAIPSDLKLKDGCGKYILRRAAEKWLPHDMAFRKKIGFATPLVHWFGGEEFRPEIERVLFGDIAAEYFNLDFLRRLWRIYQTGNENVWRIIYTAYIFVLWVENCYNGPGEKKPSGGVSA